MFEYIEINLEKLQGKCILCENTGSKVGLSCWTSIKTINGNSFKTKVADHTGGH